MGYERGVEYDIIYKKRIGGGLKYNKKGRNNILFNEIHESIFRKKIQKKEALLLKHAKIFYSVEVKTSVGIVHAFTCVCTRFNYLNHVKISHYKTLISNFSLIFLYFDKFIGTKFK